jgi:hypothetical protein
MDTSSGVHAPRLSVSPQQTTAATAVQALEQGIRPVNRAASIADALLLAYVFLSPFTALFILPYFRAKIQPTEILFLVLLPFGLIGYGRRLLPLFRWQAIFAAYVLANICAGVISLEHDGVLESLGRGYLIVLAALVAAYVGRHDSSGLRGVALAWAYGGALLAVVSLAGYVLALAGYGNTTVKEFANYPYLGSVKRAAGFTGGPGMLVLVLAFPILWLWTTDAVTKWRRTLWAVVSLATLLSLSKEIALIALGMALLDPRFERRFTRWKTALVLVVALVLWTGTHFLVVANAPVHESYLAGTPYTSEHVDLTFGKIQIVETSYSALKRANWIVGRGHPIVGVGPGNFNKYLPALKDQGAYPKRLPNYDPHSTWMGGFSETGLLGVLTLGIMVAAWFALIKRRGLITSTDSVVRAAAVYLLILLIESVMIDAMNFRQLWIAIGMVMAYTPPGEAPIFECRDSAS